MDFVVVFGVQREAWEDCASMDFACADVKRRTEVTTRVVHCARLRKEPAGRPSSSFRGSTRIRGVLASSRVEEGGLVLLTGLAGSAVVVLGEVPPLSFSCLYVNILSSILRCTHSEKAACYVCTRGVL